MLSGGERRRWYLTSHGWPWDITIFHQGQEAYYFQNMMSAMGKSFFESIKIGEMVEDSQKIKRILSQAVLKATSQAIQNGSMIWPIRKARRRRHNGFKLPRNSEDLESPVHSSKNFPALIPQLRNLLYRDPTTIRGDEYITLYPTTKLANTSPASQKFTSTKCKLLSPI